MDNLERLKKLNEFLNDFWKLIKETYDFEPNERYWSALTTLAIGLAEKHAGSEDQRFVKAMLNAYLDYQERRYIESREA